MPASHFRLIKGMRIREQLQAVFLWDSHSVPLSGLSFVSQFSFSCTFDTGKEFLTTYSFNTKVAKHTFCSVCGVQSFYSPRSNPDGIGKTLDFMPFLVPVENPKSSSVGVMPHCIDGNTLKVKYETFNGDSWETEILRKKHVREMSRAKTSE